MLRLPRHTTRLGKRLVLRALGVKDDVSTRSLASAPPKSHLAPLSPVLRQSFLNGTSSAYIDEMYTVWQQDPSKVHKSWDAYFRALTTGAPVGSDYVSPYQLLSQLGQSQIAALQNMLSTASSGGALPQFASSDHSLANQANISRVINDHLNVQALIRYYQLKGHHIAKLDPLGIGSADLSEEIPEELQLETYGFTEKDLDRPFRVTTASTYIAGDTDTELTLKEILNRLQESYCNHIGVEYLSVSNREQINWLKQRFEKPNIVYNSLTIDDKRLLLARVVRSTMFEQFLAKKWPGEKRFGLEGCEVLIPSMKTIIDRATEHGVSSFIIGMPHRGRLNVLANVCRKPLEQLFCQFDPHVETNDSGSGDVKYHLGMSHERINRVTNKKIKIAVVANPSHLEAVDPVVQGKAKAEMYYRGDEHGKTVMSILLHGDAAFAGQGVVYETLHLSDLPHYTTHGTIHIVVNNQIGFTTDPRMSRSSPYCTDVAHVLKAPIFHVNSDDPEAVAYVSRVATDWRSTFGKDCVIDLVCYRRHGHNEMDEPMYTQPRMYTQIAKHPRVLDIYSKKLLEEGVVSNEEYQAEVQKYEKVCEDAFKKSKKNAAVRWRDWLDSPWSSFFETRDPMKLPITGVDDSILQLIGTKMCEIPGADFTLHRGLVKVLEQRRNMVKDRWVDWAMAESMAFGSLLLEGTHVRLSGQDVERGTFSQRHHVLHDQKVDKHTHVPLNQLTEKAKYEVCNSSLSEFAVLGFELGYSMQSPDALVLWEAQFGDFANNAQCIIDQFISSGQSKWVRQSGIVLMLPHGYEGMGPEHSSARLERYLQSCSDDTDLTLKIDDNFEMQQLHECNWIVANCTSPANHFHILRRQIHLPFRKPLVLMTPKSGLRHKDVKSPFEDMASGSRYQRLIPDKGPAGLPENAEKVRKLVFCSGKVYFDVRKEREVKQLDSSIALVRVEQLAPFPHDLVIEQLRKYPNAQICWLQEEHKNQGAWSYIKPRMRTSIRSEGSERPMKYIGRDPSSSTATGNKHQHMLETAKLLNEALSLE